MTTSLKLNVTYHFDLVFTLAGMPTTTPASDGSVKLLNGTGTVTLDANGLGGTVTKTVVGSDQLTYTGNGATTVLTVTEYLVDDTSGAPPAPVLPDNVAFGTFTPVTSS